MQANFMSNNSEDTRKPEQMRQLDHEEEAQSASLHMITAEQLKAIGRGKIRRKSGQKKELDQIKMNFDVIYQP